MGILINPVISVLAKLAAALATELVIKKFMVLLAEEIVKRTESDVDDKVLKIVKEAWGE